MSTTTTTTTTTTTDEVVKVRLVKGEPVADVDALRKYQREYYRATKQGVECEHCKHTYTSQSACVRHMRRSQKWCQLLRATTELEMLRSGQVGKLSETDV